MRIEERDGGRRSNKSEEEAINHFICSKEGVRWARRAAGVGWGRG